MADANREYWLKLKKDFFASREIKRLRFVAGGDTYTVIFLKMQLLSMEDGGKLFFTGFCDSFAQELALDLEERPDDVAVTLQFLLKCGLMEKVDEKTYLIPFVKELTGSESQSAIISREWRAKKTKPECELQRNSNELQCNANELQCNLEKEKQKESIANIYNNISNTHTTLSSTDISTSTTTLQSSTISQNRTPSVKEVREFAIENKIEAEIVNDFWTKMVTNNWMLNGSAVGNWKSLLKKWQRPGKPSTPKKKPFSFERNTDYDSMMEGNDATWN